jgi:hypothetical protein
MEKLKFYDLKGKKSFTTSSYKHVHKSGRNFAVAKAPSGAQSWRIMPKKGALK